MGVGKGAVLGVQKIKQFKKKNYGLNLMYISPKSPLKIFLIYDKIFLSIINILIGITTYIKY